MNTNLFLVFFSIVFFSILPTYGQEDPFYENIVASSKNDLDKLVALDSLISNNRKKDNGKFINYSLQYIELAKEMDSIEAAAKKLINVSYSLTSIKNEPRKVVTLVDGILARKYKVKDSFLLGSLYLKRGSANFRLDLDQAVLDYNEAIQNYGANDSVYVADAFLFRGQAYSNLGKFVPAGESYKTAYNYFESLKDYEYMFYARQGVTTMFSMNGFYNKAKEEREKNIIKIKALHLDHHLVTTYYNQALDYKKIGNNREYIKYLLLAEEAIENDNDNKVNLTNKLLVYAKLVDYYASTYNLEKAKPHVDFFRKANIENDDDLLNKSMYHYAMANYYYLKSDYNRAISHANDKLKAAKKLKSEGVIMDAYELLSKVYEAKGDYKRSLEHVNTYMTIKDSTFNKTTANTLAYYQTLYEIEKKENELIEQSTNIRLLEKDNQSARRRSLYIALAVFAIFLMILLYRNRMRVNSQKVLQEKFSQELLVSQEEERRRMAKDLHDGLGQRLLLIKNKVHSSNDTEAKTLVETAIEEVRAISRNLHPFQLQEFGITKAIEMTINQIDENTTLFISSEIDNIDNLFTKKQEVNLYRIVQESLSNILKHAKAEAGKVVIKREPNFVKLTIRDNGVGFDFTEKYQEMKSLGLKTLLERTKFLKGQMKIHSKKNNGTLIEFQFPTA